MKKWIVVAVGFLLVAAMVSPQKAPQKSANGRGDLLSPQERSYRESSSFDHKMRKVGNGLSEAGADLRQVGRTIGVYR